MDDLITDAAICFRISARIEAVKRNLARLEELKQLALERGTAQDVQCLNTDIVAVKLDLHYLKEDLKTYET